MFKNSLFILRYCLALTCSLLLAATCHAADHGKAAKPDFGEFTAGTDFKLNTLPTTKYGPAWADILLRPSNFLECSGAPLALCYYSGAGPVTPCTTDGKGMSNCTCYELPAGTKYMVDINAILDLDVYKSTVKTCGHNGHKCLPHGSLTAPVCTAINNKTMFPKADLISTFSLALEKQMPISETNCPTPAAYAGCMTAPCKRTGNTDPATGLPLVQCACPTFTGPFQVGTAIRADQCTLGNNLIWSAGYKPPKSKPGKTGKASAAASN